MRSAVPGLNLAMFGLQSATAPLQSAAICAVPHGLGATAMFGLQSATAPLQSATFHTAQHAVGATRGMCGFPGNRRGSANFRYFAAQTQQMRAPWSASIARPPDSCTQHTQPPSAHAHQGTCAQRAHRHAPCNQVKSNHMRTMHST